MDINGHTPLYEDYVSFEVAKLLKEKGFKERTYGVYNSEGGFSTNNPDICWNEKDIPFISAPTLQMARKWIRLTYKIYIRIFEDTLGTVYEWQIYKDGVCQKHSFIEDSYEKALDTAIKYCLINLI